MEHHAQIQLGFSVFGQEGNGDRGDRLADVEGGLASPWGESLAPADQDPITRASRLGLQRHRLAGAKQVDLDEVGPSTQGLLVLFLMYSSRPWHGPYWKERGSPGP